LTGEDEDLIVSTLVGKGGVPCSQAAEDIAGENKHPGPGTGGGIQGRKGL